MPKPEISPKKQFDLSHLYVAEALQGAELASFSRRALAFLIDLAILFIASEFIAFVGLIVLVLLIVRKRANKTFRSAQMRLNRNLVMMKGSLAKIEVPKKAAKRIASGIAAYIYFLLICLFIISFGSIVFWILNIVGLIDEGVNLDTFWKNSLSSFESTLDLFINFGGFFAYFLFFSWLWKGQTPGKRIFGIRAVKLDGKDLTLWNSLERTMGYTASASLALVGFIQYFWDRNHQTTHDKICETIVVRERQH